MLHLEQALKVFQEKALEKYQPHPFVYSTPSPIVVLFHFLTYLLD